VIDEDDVRLAARAETVAEREPCPAVELRLAKGAAELSLERAGCGLRAATLGMAAAAAEAGEDQGEVRDGAIV